VLYVPGGKVATRCDENVSFLASAGKTLRGTLLKVFVFWHIMLNAAVGRYGS
jgi:hypothetical protein